MGQDRYLCGSGGLTDLDVALLSLMQANTGLLRTHLRWRPITYSVGKEEEGQNWCLPLPHLSRVLRNTSVILRAGVLPVNGADH